MDTSAASEFREFLDSFQWLWGALLGAWLTHYFSAKARRDARVGRDVDAIIDILMEHDRDFPYEQILQILGPERSKGLAGALQDVARYGPGGSPQERINRIIKYGALKARHRERARSLVAEYFQAAEKLLEIPSPAFDEFEEWAEARHEVSEAAQRLRDYLRSLGR